jgi:NitT/TauT family transport system substrate-binding protein
MWLILIVWAQTPLTYAAGYIPNVQFAPFYLMQEKGYDLEEGFQLTLDYTIGPDVFRLVASGQIPLGSADPDAFLQATARGMPLIHLASLYRTSPIALMGKEGSIDSNTLRGKRVGIAGLFGTSYLGYQLLLHQLSLTPKDVQLQVVGFSQTTALHQGRVDYIVGFANHEALLLAQQETPVHLLKLETEQQIPGIGIMANATFLKEQRGLAQAFLRALFRAVEEILRDPEGSFSSIALPYLNIPPQGRPTEKALALATLQATLPYWQSSSGSLGQVDEQLWQNLVETMKTQGLSPMEDWRQVVDQSFTTHGSREKGEGF